MKFTLRGLLVALVMLAVASPAFAEITATIGDQNSSGVYRATSYFDGTSGYIVFASDTGLKYPYENYTTINTNNTLLSAESGKVITDTGGSTDATGVCTAGKGGSKHILPTAAPGLVFTFTAGSKCVMTVDTVDTNDRIRYTISGTALDGGDSIKSTGQAGDSVTLFSTVANMWDVVQMKGTWTDNGTN